MGWGIKEVVNSLIIIKQLVVQGRSHHHLAQLNIVVFPGLTNAAHIGGGGVCGVQ